MAPSIVHDRHTAGPPASESITDQLDGLFDQLSRDWFGDEHPATARLLTDAIISSYLQRRASPILTRPPVADTRFSAIVAAAARWLLVRQSAGIETKLRAELVDDLTALVEHRQQAVTPHQWLLMLRAHADA